MDINQISGSTGNFIVNDGTYGEVELSIDYEAEYKGNDDNIINNINNSVVEYINEFVKNYITTNIFSYKDEMKDFINERLTVDLISFNPIINFTEETKIKIRKHDEEMFRQRMANMNQ